MPTQKNFDGSSKGSYGVAGHDAPVSKAQTNFDGGRTTRKGGGNNSKAQVNFDVKFNTPNNVTKSHFGEKSNTGCAGGY